MMYSIPNLQLDGIFLVDGDLLGFALNASGNLIIVGEFVVDILHEQRCFSHS